MSLQHILMYVHIPVRFVVCTQYRSINKFRSFWRLLLTANHSKDPAKYNN